MMKINIEIQKNIIMCHQSDSVAITNEINRLTILLKIHSDIIAECEALIAAADDDDEGFSNEI